MAARWALLMAGLLALPTAAEMAEPKAACLVDSKVSRRAVLWDAHWAVTMVQSSAGRSVDPKGAKTAAKRVAPMADH